MEKKNTLLYKSRVYAEKIFIYFKESLKEIFYA